MKISNIPLYRFIGYTDAWELRKLGEVSSHRGGTAIENYFSEDGKYKVISIGSYGLDNQYVDQNIRAVENEITRSRVVNKNELTMVLNDKTANGNIIGRCLLIETDDEFVINQRTEILSFNNEVNPKFAYVALNGVFREQVKKIVQGGTQIYVNYSSVEQLSFSLPSLPEQKSIGTFFSTLDSQITLHQRKLDTLKEQKKTYLKLLFPAKGQTKPALRFQGFEDDWEEVKLGDVLVEYNRKSEIENQFELLSSTNSGIEPRSGRVSGESNIGYKIIKKGMVVLSPQNLWLGNINYNAKFEIGIVSPSYKVFNIDGPNELFLATVLRLPQMFFEYAQASVQGASIVRRNLDLDLFSTIAIPLPSLPEQEVIGTFFQTLDQEIAQVEDKLASLKEMKKTLLRKLFVS